MSELQISSTQRKPSDKEIQFTKQKIQGLSVEDLLKTSCLAIWKKGKRLKEEGGKGRPSGSFGSVILLTTCYHCTHYIILWVINF